MIAVIADDFTGAAEIAGICLRYGQKIELFTGEVSATDADVLIVSTDSRSLNKESALEVTAVAIRQVLQLNPDWVYKKIDSVLRGYVVDELKVQLRLIKKTKAFILPANPSLERTITNGIYFIKGVPISETNFASDPEFPIISSNVQAILQDDSVYAIKPNGELPESGVVVGEAENEADIQLWVAKMDGSYLLAGAGDFFTALLAQKFQQQPKKVCKPELPFLFICGTSYAQSVDFVKKVESEKKEVLYISKQMMECRLGNEDWLLACKSILQHKRKVIIAFNSDWIPAVVSAPDLRSIMANGVKSIMERNEIAELFIEGGSTATAILQQLNINYLTPVNEWQRGVVRMKAGNIYITVKPGSYGLPVEIKELFGN